MTWSYDTSLAAAKDKIRFYVGDTASAAAITLTDEEIAGALSLSSSSVKRAAALCAENLAARFAQAATSITDDIGQSVDYGDRAAFFQERARLLRSSIALGAIPFAGGISSADKSGQEQDTDRIVPAFTTDLHNAPGTPRTRAAGDEEY